MTAEKLEGQDTADFILECAADDGISAEDLNEFNTNSLDGYDRLVKIAFYYGAVMGVELPHALKHHATSLN
jgi:hypothetical protein